MDIETIDGTKHTIKVPKGCPVNEKIIVVGKGFENVRTKRSGNFVVIAQCDIPTKLNDEAKNTLHTYSELIGTQAKDSSGSIAGFFKKFLG